MRKALIKRMLEVKDFLVIALNENLFLNWLEANDKFEPIIEEVNLQLQDLFAKKPYLSERYVASILGCSFKVEKNKPPYRMIGLDANESLLLENFLSENPDIEKFLETILLNNSHPFSQVADTFMKQVNQPHLQLLDKVKALCSNIEVMINGANKAIVREIKKQDIPEDELTVEEWCLLLLEINFTMLNAFDELIALLREIDDSQANDSQANLNELEKFLLAKPVATLCSILISLAYKEQICKYLNQFYEFIYRWVASYIAVHKKHVEQEDNNKFDVDAWHFYLKVLIGKLVYGEDANVEHLQEFKCIWQQILKRMTHINMVEPYVFLIKQLLHGVYPNLFEGCNETQAKAEIEYWNVIKDIICQLAKPPQERTKYLINQQVVSQSVKDLPCETKRPKTKVTDPNNLLRAISAKRKQQTTPFVEEKTFNHFQLLEIIEGIIQGLKIYIKSPLALTQELTKDNRNDESSLHSPVLSPDTESSQEVETRIEPQQDVPMMGVLKEGTNNIQEENNELIKPKRFKRRVEEQKVFTNNSEPQSPLLFKSRNDKPKLILHYSSDDSPKEEEDNPGVIDGRYAKKYKGSISTFTDSFATSDVTRINSSLKNNKP